VLTERVETHVETVTGAGRLSTVASVTWLKVESVDSVRWLTIDRPERKNAIPADGWATLGDAFVEFEKGEDRVLVVTGAGGEFCSGADLDPERMERQGSVTENHLRMKVVGRAATALHRCTKPTVAAVDGVAVGAGMNLALGCDVVIASDRARFSEIFVRRGLTVDFGGTWLLPRVVGLQRAKELALSGRIIDATEAEAIGIAMQVVAPESLLERAGEIAHSFLAGAPLGQMFAKQGIDASFESSFSDSLGWESQSQSIALASEDAREGVSAFLERRDPKWKGS
jgi:enoyl-CoA hydratase/carnithine racemase